MKGGADFIVGETFDTYGEAKIALDAIETYGNGNVRISRHQYPDTSLLTYLSYETKLNIEISKILYHNKNSR